MIALSCEELGKFVHRNNTQHRNFCDWVEVMLLKRKKERNLIPEGMAFTLRMSSGQRTEWGGESCRDPKDAVQFSSVQSLSCVRLFATPWTTACQASLFITNCRSLPKSMSIESVMHPTISSSVIPFSSCPQSFPASRFFKWVSSSHEVAKVLEFQLQHQSFQWTPRTDLL